MPNKIDTVAARSKLPARREPYWHKINKGFYIGFRKMSANSGGTWLLRHRTDNGTEIESSLGNLDAFKAHERFDRATEAARDWLTRVGNTPIANRSFSVWDACTEYVKRIHELKGAKPAQDLEARYLRLVKTDPIHKIELAKLTRDDVNGFRRRVVALPVRFNKAGDTRERSKDTVNRDMASVRAALNRAFANRMVTSDFAWREPLKAFNNVSKRRGLYLDRAQRRRFIECAAEDLAILIRGLSILPLRPGALAPLTVDDFDVRLGVLRIGSDKSGQDRRIKLSAAIADLFGNALETRAPTDPLIARSDGQPWNKDSWKGPIKDAAMRAGLPAKTTAYTLRHSVITDLVHGGLDLLTVPQISGTSVAMVEKHYGHLRSDIAAEALAKLLL
jgi:integrase